MEALVKARKVGGSLMVHLPLEIVEHERIEPNELVRIHIEKIPQDWFGKFKGVGSFTVEDELNTHD